MLVSIIVPVYNGEQYLKRCVESLLIQPNAEIILVNDGSTDDSGRMCDEYSRKYDNIHVIHQKNAGDGAARNAGLEIFQGEYVMFVDADDYIPADTVEKMLFVAEQEKADIVIGTVNVEEENPTEKVFMTANQMLSFGINQERYLRQHKLPAFTIHINPGSQCMKLIRRELFTDRKVRFHTNIRMHHQDTLFSMKLYQYCNKVCLMNKKAYYYDTEIPGSMRKRMAKNKKEEVKILIQEMSSVINMYSMPENEKKELALDFAMQMIYECWSEYYIHADNKETWGERKRDLKEFLNEICIKFYLENLNPSVLECYPKYKQYIMKQMKSERTGLLAGLAIFWSMKKRMG